MRVDHAAVAFLDRLDAVEDRLESFATRGELAGLTDADEKTGERWDAGQVWAHLGEFIPYWLSEAAMVVAQYHGEPVPFGRVKSDPERLAAIERDRGANAMTLMGRVRDDIAAVRGFVQGLDEQAWTARGVHQTLGVMDLGAIIDEFLVGHLEEHADQLEGLGSG